MKSSTWFVAAAVEQVSTSGTSAVLQRIQDLWTIMDNGLGVWAFLLIGIATILIGVFVWWRIYARIECHRSLLSQLPSIIAHVHHRKVNTGHHIVAAIFGFSGLSLIAGFIWAKMFSSQESTAGYMMTNAGLALGVLTLILAIWTLNQTMRLERLQGERIERFDELINKISEEMRELMRRYDENRDKASDLFRVILVTNNPFFGIVSYRGKPVTLGFKNAFDALADRIKAEKEKQRESGSGFRVKLICADKNQMNSFLDLYYESTEANERSQVLIESEDFIESLRQRMGEESVVRAPIKISEAQFAVVGDVVFEFLLESPAVANGRKVWKARGSNIRATNRIEDRDAADRFERFTHFLEELILDGNGAAASSGGGGSPQPPPPAHGTQVTASAQLVASGTHQSKSSVDSTVEAAIPAKADSVQSEAKEHLPKPD